ncbi:hypothetical protein [Treponema endosymbiont of Eucomonympha sp.]|uniref:hypothetical protein n=1 Tax=Treponema endosymbiont of Eucomonympha sp. TaxID=1580831 RepID=UPI0013968FCF|nr:hypothetical protein [Treponema endosymbiont of Eucomonympha sp.]
MYDQLAGDYITTVLWFKLNCNYLRSNVYQPTNVIYTPYGSDEAIEIKAGKLVEQGAIGDDDESYWEVFSSEIDPTTPITANGTVSFEIISQTIYGGRYHPWHTKVEVFVYYSLV